MLLQQKRKKTSQKKTDQKPQKQPSLCQSNYENNDFLVLMKKQHFFKGLNFQL